MGEPAMIPSVTECVASGPQPYYADDLVTLYHGDCREITTWLAADVLVSDPPYGRDWDQGWKKGERQRGVPRPHLVIAGDADTSLRDWALTAWGNRHGVVFGDLLLPAPADAKQCLIYRKPAGAGSKGTRAGFRRDVEGIYLTGPWKPGLNGCSSVLTTGSPMQGGPLSAQSRYGHPHAKPVDVMETLIAACPPGVIADPFAGAGSTLVAARNLGRPAIGVELEERFCERAALRLSQAVLDFTA